MLIKKDGGQKCLVVVELPIYTVFYKSMLYLRFLHRNPSPYTRI